MWFKCSFIKLINCIIVLFAEVISLICFAKRDDDDDMNDVDLVNEWTICQLS